MKTTYLAFLALLMAVLALQACTKENISGDKDNLLTGSYIKLDSTINTNLDFSNADATVSILVSEYGSAVDNINIYLSTGANYLDTTGWKFVKSVSYAGNGTVLQVSTAEIAAALAPNSITPGTQYTLVNEVITTDGRKFSVANTPTSYSSFPVYKMALSWPATAVCAFNAAESAGVYTVVQDDWADYEPGETITVEAGPGDNQLNFLGYPSSAYGGQNQVNTVIDINPATGAATVARQPTGQYSNGVGVEVQATGFVFSCTGVITLTQTVYYGGTPYAGLKMILQKQ